MENLDIIERPMSGLYPEFMSRVCISHAAAHMSFLSDIQKALIPIRKEAKFKAERETGQIRTYSLENQIERFAGKSNWKHSSLQGGSKAVLGGNF
jgi:hypothetical protein